MTKLWTKIKDHFGGLYTDCIVSHINIFHALPLAGSQRRCLNMSPLGQVFKCLPRDPASVNAKKKHV